MPNRHRGSAPDRSTHPPSQDAPTNLTNGAGSARECRFQPVVKRPRLALLRVASARERDSHRALSGAAGLMPGHGASADTSLKETPALVAWPQEAPDQESEAAENDRN